jgi:hypothetical protein
VHMPPSSSVESHSQASLSKIKAAHWSALGIPRRSIGTRSEQRQSSVQVCSDEVRLLGLHPTAGFQRSIPDSGDTHQNSDCRNKKKSSASQKMEHAHPSGWGDVVRAGRRQA